MDDEMIQLLREIRDAVKSSDESKKGVFVIREEVERSTRRMERQKYAFIAAVFAAFVLGLMGGYFVALATRTG